MLFGFQDPIGSNGAVKRLSLLLLLLPLGGCVAAAVAGATAFGVIKYKNNEALRDYGAPLAETWDATLRALDDIGHPVDLEREPGKVRGDYDDVEVVVETLDDGYTRVRVRYGTFETDSNKRRARTLLNRIAERLGEDAA